MLWVATAGGIGDIALKLWAVSQLPYLAQTRGPFGVGLLLVFNRTPSYDFEQVAPGQTLVVVIKFLVLGYLGWRLKGWWRSLGLGLILGGAVANVGNWLVTHAVADFLIMPWATVNLADLLIVVGTTVIFAGWAARVVRHLTRRTRPVMTGKSTDHNPHRLRTVRTLGTCVEHGDAALPSPTTLTVDVVTSFPHVGRTQLPQLELRPQPQVLYAGSEFTGN
jgi:lipoprotein signal peptidase